MCFIYDGVRTTIIINVIVCSVYLLQGIAIEGTFFRKTS